MSTISEKLETINSVKTGLKEAIEAKGVNVGNAPFTNYPQKVSEISGGSEINNQDLTVTVNGEYTASEGYTGLGTVTVNIPQYALPTNAQVYGPDSCRVLSDGLMTQEIYTTNVQSGITYTFDEPIVFSSNNDTLELIVKTTYWAGSSDCTIFAFWATGNFCCLDLYNNYRFWIIGSGTSSEHSFSPRNLASGDTFYYKTEIKGGNSLSFYISKDGKSYTKLGTQSINNALTRFETLSLSKAEKGNTYNTRQWFYLPECSLKFNGEKVTDFVIETKGENSFDIIGSPIIDVTTGEVSGFRANRFLQLQQSPDFSTADTWEMGVKIKTGSNISTEQYIITSSINNQSIVLGFYNSKFYFNLGGGSSWWLDTADFTETPSTNTIYWIKLEFTGTEYVMSISTDGINYSDIHTYSSTNKISSGSNYTFYICSGRAGNGLQFLGSIFINDCYINLNGSRWWTGQTRQPV